MLIKYYFFNPHLDQNGMFVECKSSNMNTLTDLLKKTNPEDDAPWVNIKIVALDFPETQVLKRVRLFLNVSSSLGTREHLIVNSLESNLQEILDFPDESGLFYKEYFAHDQHKVKFSNDSGSNYENGIKLLVEEEPVVYPDEPHHTYMHLNDSRIFKIQFVESEEMPNKRFFLSLEAHGELEDLAEQTV